MNRTPHRPSHLALVQQWWVRWRSIDPVQSAFAAVRAKHLDAVIKTALVENRRHGRLPGTFAELAEALNRDSVNVYRWRTAHAEPSMPDWLSLAEILNVPPERLMQMPNLLLPGAIHILCGRSVDEEEATIFSEYVITPDRHDNGTLDATVVRAVAGRAGRRSRTSESATRSIWKVADQLEPILQRVASQDAGGRGGRMGC